MRLLVTGAGRGGTNWATEIVRASGRFHFTEKIEDRNFFKRKCLKKNYATKLATENQGFSYLNLIKKMEKYNNLKVIMVTRHPVDNCLSKIKRGQPQSMGGDNLNENIANDGTVNGAINAMKHMFVIFALLEGKYPDRFIHIKMENFILDISSEVKKICDFLEIQSDHKMYNAHKNNRNQYQKNRYGNKIDKSQIDLYRNWDKIYNGFFKDKFQDIVNIKKELKRITVYLGYQLD